MVCNLELGEHFAVVIADLRKRKAVLVDELLIRLLVPAPSDADEVGGVLEFLCCLLDRGGFCVAERSSGGPKPEHGWFVVKLGSKIDFAAAHERRGELEGFWGRNGGSCWLGAVTVRFGS